MASSNRLWHLSGILAIVIAPTASAAAEERFPPPQPARTAGEPVGGDERVLAASGIRELGGRHIVLYTDLPAAPGIDALPRIFDAAVPLWNRYFAVAPSASANWRISTYLMGNKERFEQHRLVPADLPPFLFGYQRGSEVWL
jgi:hypothetical protein